jgi:DNA repair exonuclease SbcCD nuclease subunit
MNRLTRKTIIKTTLGTSLVLLALTVTFAGCQTIGREKTAGNKSGTDSWCFVSTPDFPNFDVPNPWPQWEDAVSWYLKQIKAENPDFVLVAGDTVNGHWWDGQKCVEQMSALYFEGWKRRMEQAGLKYYVAVGDHELGDDPWPEEKVAVVPFLEQAFAEHYQMPDNGPGYKKRLTYYVRYKNALIVTVETFEVVDGVMHVDVMGEQLEWLKKVFAENKDAQYIIVQGHVPIYGPAASRSSSELYLEGGKDSEFWQVMKEAGVDVYLCGEFHDVTISESDGIWHIVHGSSWGREIVNTQDYLVCNVFPDRLELEMKSFPMEASGGYMWNLHKDRGPRDIVEISDETKQAGQQTTGTLTIKKTETGKEYLNRTGIFE